MFRLPVRPGVASLTGARCAALAMVGDGTEGGGDGPYYHSEIVAVEPAIPGVSVTIDHAGEVLTVTNRGDRTVIVRGYGDEEFLKIGPRGVAENVTSMTSALNSGRIEDEEVAAQLAAAQRAGVETPVWERQHDQSRAAWHDLRTSWSADERPPSVRKDPYADHEVATWAIPIQVGKDVALVRGRVLWTGLSAKVEDKAGLPRRPTLLLSALTIGAVAGSIGLLARRRTYRREH
jgi:hypothetical protein